jgi:hypothetical protein
MSGEMHQAERVLNDLRKACIAAGSQAAWAEAHDVSPALLSETLSKRRDLSPAVLSALGYERVVLYRKRK